MKDYAQIIKALTSNLWLMEESSLGMMLDIINRRLNDQGLSDDMIKLRIEQAEHGDREMSRIEVGGGVGIMPIYGPIFPKANLMTEVSGATNLQNVRSDLQSLLADDKVKTIIMDIDSPGGSANMIEETGDLIREAKEQKPIIAVANTDANSGAYWLGSQASEFYATPSGKVGSIGVYTVHEDKSQQNERDGRKVTYISAGKFKTAGNPDEPLTGEAREYIQEHVDETMSKFVGAVSEGRRLDKDSVMPFADGRIFSADKALSMGMIDGVKSLDAVVDGTLAENYTPRIRSTLQGAMTKHRHSADMLKAEHADLEHSEPGTGSPPERRTDNDIPEDDMYRRDQPPIIHELEEQEEGSMEEFLKQLRESLGLKVDASETEVAEAWASNVSRVAASLGIEGENPAFSTVVARAEEVDKELAPLRKADLEVGQRKAFREQYPEEYARMQKLEATDVENKAKSFSNRYDRFPALDKENKPTDEKTTRGFSALVLNDIEASHKAISTDTFSHTELQSLLDHIAANGIVEYGERGSTREKESRVIPEGGSKGGGEDRQAFSALVEEIMEEDSLEMKDAIVVAAKRDPELYAAYRSNVHTE